MQENPYQHVDDIIIYNKTLCYIYEFEFLYFMEIYVTLVLWTGLSCYKHCPFWIDHSSQYSMIRDSVESSDKPQPA